GGMGEQVGGELALSLGAVATAAVLGHQGDADVEGPRARVGPVVDGVVADVPGQGAAVQLDQQVAAVLAQQAVLLEPAPQLPVGREPEPVVVALRLRVVPPALQGVEVGAADRPEAQGHGPLLGGGGGSAEGCLSGG